MTRPHPTHCTYTARSCPETSSRYLELRSERFPSLLMFSCAVGNFIRIGSRYATSSLLSIASLLSLWCRLWCVLFRLVTASSRSLLLPDIEDIPDFACYEPWSCGSCTLIIQDGHLLLPIHLPPPYSIPLKYLTWDWLFNEATAS